MATETGRRRTRRARSRQDGRTPPLYAAVDLGTNNCRLLVAKPSGRRFRIVDSYSQIARLGEGLAATGDLSEAAMDRAVDALGKIREKLRARSVGRVRCIATEACRKAGNGRAFIDRVQQETGLSFKIIGPKEEARLALIGCHDLVAPGTHAVLILDVGGGSTELSLVDAEAVEKTGGLPAIITQAPMRFWTSLPLGVVTLYEKFAHLPEAEGYSAMVAHARETFAAWRWSGEVAGELQRGPSHFIGTSGTVTCLAGVHLGLERYRRDAVDGTWLSHNEVHACMAHLIEIGHAGRARLPTIGVERADYMVSGCAILEAAWSVFPAERLRVADRGLREGLLLSMMYGPRTKRRRVRSRAAARKEPSDG